MWIPGTSGAAASRMTAPALYATNTLPAGNSRSHSASSATMASSTRHYRCETAVGRKGGEGGECALLERSCFALHRELPWEWTSRSALSAPVAAIGDARVSADDILERLLPNSHRVATGRSLPGEHSESSARSPARVSDAPQLEEDCNRRTRWPLRAIHPQKVSDAAQLDEGCNGSTPCAQCAPHPGKVRDGS